MIKNIFKLAPITKFPLEQIFDFTTAHLSRVEPLCKHFSYPQEKFQKDFFRLVQLCYESGLSYTAKTDDQIASIILAMPFRSLSQYISQLTPDYYSDVGAPIFAVLDKVDDQYQPENPEKTVYIFIVTTEEKFKGKGLVQKMIAHLEEKATREGFSEYFCECTGKISQKIFTKMDYMTLREVQYRTFEYKGKLPFRNLTQADSVKLMVKKTSAASSIC